MAESFSLIAWLLTRRAAYRDKHGGNPPLHVQVAPDVEVSLRAEIAARLGWRYAKLLGRSGSVWYGMVFSVKRDLPAGTLEFMR